MPGDENACPDEPAAEPEPEPSEGFQQAIAQGLEILNERLRNRAEAAQAAQQQDELVVEAAEAGGFSAEEQEAARRRLAAQYGGLGTAIRLGRRVTRRDAPSYLSTSDQQDWVRGNNANFERAVQQGGGTGRYGF